MVTHLIPTKIYTLATTLHFLQAHIYTVTREDDEQKHKKTQAEEQNDSGKYLRTTRILGCWDPGVTKHGATFTNNFGARVARLA